MLFTQSVLSQSVGYKEMYTTTMSSASVLGLFGLFNHLTIYPFKMKKLLLILLALPMIGFGQVTTPSVVSSSGDSYSNGNIIMDYTEKPTGRPVSKKL